MALSGFLFLSVRILEIIVTIPILGMLAYFVHGYVLANALTPTYILVLFIVSVLAAAWAVATTVTYLRARHSASFVALVDLAFVGAFIAGVYLLRGITKANCVNFQSGSFQVSLGALGYFGHNGDASDYSLNANKTCTMLKASFALGIIDILLFFTTFLLALLVSRHHRRDDRVVVKREYHSSRHGHRRSPSGRGSYDGSYRPSSGHRSHRSNSRRTYYV